MFPIKNSSRDSHFWDFAICREDYVALLEKQNGHDHVALFFLGNTLVIFFQTELKKKKLIECPFRNIAFEFICASYSQSSLMFDPL